MPQTRTYLHPEGAGEMRADKALSAFLSGEISRTRLEDSFKAGKVLLGGSPIAKKYLLRAGDKIVLEIPDTPKTVVEPVDIAVEVLYEDGDIVVVNKPSGMTVHPGSGTGEDTLVHAMMHICKGNLSLAGGSLRPGIVHRLDKETSGVMVMAKSDAAYFKLVEAFSQRLTRKEYIALASGAFHVSNGSVQKPIGRDPVHKTKMCISEGPDARDARTDWRVLDSYGGRASLVACRIYTGRTHQIRVHMSDMGHPIFGDYTYKFQKNKFREIPPPQRVMLHSWRLELPHPISGKTMTFEAPPPEDFASLAKLLKRTYTYTE